MCCSIRVVFCDIVSDFCFVVVSDLLCALCCSIGVICFVL